MIVVTGATGNVGRPLVRVLAEAGEEVAAVSRGDAREAVPDGVTHHRADLADAGSLRPALAGADALFLLVPEVGTHLDPHAIVDVVTSAGIPRVTLLSSQVVGTRSVTPAPLRRVEEVIEQSGLEWTHLRPARRGPEGHRRDRGRGAPRARTRRQGVCAHRAGGDIAAETRPHHR